MNSQLLSQVSNALSVEIREENIQKLHGDASTRTYWRINTNIGSWILSEQEPFNADDDFINISNYLTNHNIPVPKIIKSFPKEGVIILQDAGDQLLYNLAIKHPLDAVKQYEMAVDVLIRLQTSLPKEQSCVAFKRAFDEGKWLWELEHTEKYFFKQFLSLKLSTAQHSILTNGFKTIASSIDLRNPTFCHRDFHSRNLLYFSANLYLIDFQDARLGPPLYDLVSILRDCYILLPISLEKTLITRYINGTGKTPSNLEEQYNIVALQRHLKACGTFAYQYIERKNKFYLQFIRQTWEMILKEAIMVPKLREFYTLINDFSLPEIIN